MRLLKMLLATTALLASFSSAHANFTYDFTAAHESGSHAGYISPTPLTGFITLLSNADGLYSDDNTNPFITPDFPFASNVVAFSVTDGLTTDNSLGFGSYDVLISGGSITNWNLQSVNFGVVSNPYAYNGDVNFSPATFTLRNTTAVPEPETYGMMLLGLGLLGFTAKRKQKMTV